MATIQPVSSRQTARKVEADDALAWLGTDEPTLVVAGSGLSLGAPTWAPGAGSLSKLILSRLYGAADYIPLDSALLERLSPEAVCGAVAETTGDRSVLQIWSVLDANARRRTGSVPNVGHHALVTLSASVGWPILTTNVDHFLELAAGELGLGCEANDLDPASARHLIERRPDTAHILKVHGSAKRPQTVKSTVADLSQCARALRRVEIKPAPRRLLLIGYSARDFDLFPWLLTTFRGMPALWVDPHAMRRDPATGDLLHRVHSIEGARFCEVPWNALAGQFAAPVIAASREDRVEAACRKAINAQLERYLDPLLTRPGTAIAALTALCASAGAYQDAARLADRWLQVKDSNAQVQTLLWGAHASSSIDRFWRARKFASDARRQASFDLVLSDVGRASLAATHAKASNLWLTAIPGPADVPFRLRRWAASAGVVRTALVWAAPALLMARNLRPERRQSGSHRARNLAPERLRLCADYLEHLIRLLSYVDAASRSRTWMRGPVLFVWKVLRRACESIGYSWGALKVTGRTSRWGHDFTGPTGALTTAEILGDPVELAVTKIAYALDLLADGQGNSDHAPDPLALLREALAQAAELGSPSLQLKCHVELRRAIPGYKVDATTVAELVDSAECEAIQLARNGIIGLLAGS